MSVLTQIVSQRRARVGQLYQELAHYVPGVTATNLRQQVLPRMKKVMGFRAHIIDAPRRALILECKAASPSKGTLRNNYDPAELARAYEPYATAISVLCEPDSFQGKFGDLARVAQVSDLPLLAKDFIIDPVQIALAYVSGADAVLLMLSVLDDDDYRRLSAYAHGLGLDVLTEVITKEEALRANALGATMVDINHRNLHTLDIDMNRSRDLAKYLAHGTVVVAASGMNSAADIDRSYGDAFLVGSALSGRRDVEVALKELMYGQVKVCGLTTATAAIAAQKAGVIYGGVNFVPTSPRYVDRETATRISQAAPKLRIFAVTCAVDEDELRDVIDAVNECNLYGIQLHAPQQDDERAFINRVRHLTDLPIIRALPHTVDPDVITDIAGDVMALIIDSPRPGSGTTWDYDSISRHARDRIWIAGGVGATNARDIRRLGFGGIDANSALEKNDGSHDKDPKKIQDMMDICAGRKGL